MLYSIFGSIKYIENNYVVINTHGLSFKVFVPKIDDYKINDETELLIYEIIKENEISLVGFKTREELELFEKIININGFGVKMGLSIVGYNEYESIIEALQNKDTKYLSNIPTIGRKSAELLAITLSDWAISTRVFANKNYSLHPKENKDSVYSALTALGFKQKEINSVLNSINGEGKTSDELFKECLIKIKK